MFKYKTGVEIAAMTEAERDQYAVDKRKHEAEVMNKAIDARIAEMMPKEPTEAEKTAAAALATKTKTEWAEMQESIAALKDAGVQGTVGTLLATSLKEQMDEIKGLATKKSGAEVVIKALTNRASIAGNQQAQELTDIGQLAYRKLSLYDIFPKLTVGENNNGTIRYYDWDKATIARAAAAVAEGAVFPESTAKFVTNTITLAKIGDTLPVTAEFFEDETMFAAELSMFLQINVNLEIDRQLWQGDGSANQLTGIKATIVAGGGTYVPVASGIVDANIYDLITEGAAAITIPGGAKYNPNFALMNKVDINRMQLKKDANHNYILPPFVSKDGMQVGAITIIEANIVDANTMLMGDSAFAKIYEKTGIELSQGMINDQFTRDEWTLKVRKRMCFLIRSADIGGFLYISDITGALVTLAS